MVPDAARRERLLGGRKKTVQNDRPVSKCLTAAGEGGKGTGAVKKRLARKE